MRSSGILFVAALWAVGLTCGIVVARRPDLVPLPVPHFTVPLIVGLIIDVATRPAIHAGRIAPVTMGERGIGVIGAAIISFAMAALLGNPRIA